MTNWSRLSSEATLRRQGVAAKPGLSYAEADKRLRSAGKNTWVSTPKIAFSSLLISRLEALSLLILFVSVLAGSIIYLSNLGNIKNASLSEALVSFIILLIITLGAWLYKKHLESSVVSAQILAPESTKVRRGGRIVTAASSSLVPGDIVLLKPGDTVPADLRLISAQRLKIDETKITGLALPADKNIFILNRDLEKLEMKNMAWAGSRVVHGSGEGVVVATGKATTLAQLLATAHAHSIAPSFLRAQLAQRSAHLSTLILLICPLVLVLSVFAQSGLGAAPRYIIAIMSASALAVVAASPGIYLVALGALLKSIERSKRVGLTVNNVAAYESLSGLDVICIQDLSSSELSAVHRLQTESGIRIVLLASSKDQAKEVMSLHSGIDGKPVMLKGKSFTPQQLLGLTKATSVFIIDDLSQKLRIINALKSQHLCVAMLGSAKEDLPLLKAASLGIDLGVQTDSGMADLSLAGGLPAIYEAILNSRRSFMVLRQGLTMLNLYVAFIFVGATALLIIPIGNMISIPLILSSGAIGYLMFWALIRRSGINQSLVRARPAEFKKN